MSSDSTALQPLSMLERRVLGVLVEKSKTTPDAYPMSVNALTTGCNQKSNRDPVMDVDDLDIEGTLNDLQPKGLVTKITGSRVVRYKHNNLYDRWEVGKIELAVLAELLLRGPQTEGELRGRASRMEPIDDLDKLREVLRPLAARKLVVMLGPEGRRGTLITHGFHTPQELDGLRNRQERADDAEPAAPVRSAEPARYASAEQLAALQGEVAALRTQLQQVQDALQETRGQLQALRQSLGA